jgi:hypothetical protein
MQPMMNPMFFTPLLGAFDGLAGYDRDDDAARIEPAAVEARIKKLRAGTLTVKAAPGASVQVRQVRHEFLEQKNSG